MAKETKYPNFSSMLPYSDDNDVKANKRYAAFLREEERLRARDEERFQVQPDAKDALA